MVDLKIVWLRFLFKRKRITAACLTCALLQGCTLSDARIEDRAWKCGTPCGLPDVLYFGDAAATVLRNDTLVLQGVGVGRIAKREARWYADNLLYVVNIRTGDTCVYYEK